MIDVPGPQLTAEKRRLLELIAEIWREGGMWPKRKQLRFRLEKQGIDLDTLEKTVPTALLSDHDNADAENARVRLTVAGLELTKNGAVDVAPFVQFVVIGVQRYLALHRPVTLSTREEGLLANREPSE